jgi:methyl coenzyme M reductase gamma subunit
MFHGQGHDFGVILFYLKLLDSMYNSPMAALIRSIDAACQFVVVAGVDPCQAIFGATELHPSSVTSGGRKLSNSYYGFR